MTPRIEALLAQTPVVDGHNDLPWRLRSRVRYGLAALDIAQDQSAAGLHTDIPRLRRGGVGAQFWSVFVPCSLPGPAAVTATLEQIDTVHNLVHSYASDLVLARTADDVEQAWSGGRVASLIGMEGGHSIDCSLGTLRMMHALGVRYLTLTHTKNTPWADSATDTPGVGGLSPFGHEVVRECNRLGVMVDLSHVADTTMHAALDTSTAPAFFSHSSARALCGHARNIPDDVLSRVRDTDGIAMVTFVPGFLTEECRVWMEGLFAEQDRLAEEFAEESPEYLRAEKAWLDASPRPPCDVTDVADHIEHIRRVAGVDHVGLGSDFDGVTTTPDGLDGVDGYPALLAELADRGWTDADLGKLTWHNALRVLRATEAAARDAQRARGPSLATFGPSPAPSLATLGGADQRGTLGGADQRGTLGGGLAIFERFKLDEIAVALAADEFGIDEFVDPATGEMHSYSDETGLDGDGEERDVDEDLPESWLYIHPLPASEWYQDMVDFADRVSHHRVGRRLADALDGKGAFRRFKDVVFNDPELGPAWNEFSGVRGRQHAVDWLFGNQVVTEAQANAYAQANPDPDVP